MMKCASSYLVPCAFGVAGLVLLCLVGCGERAASEPAAEASPKTAAQHRMEDPVYRKQLDGQLAARNELASVRGRLVAQMEAMVAAARKAQPGADDAAIKAALEKDPAWRSLYARVLDVNAALEDNRKQSQEIVRNRLVGESAK